ncbi:hypothetical protein HK405_007134 [Cladochytrium tenue]|nr:hypothetical protein HK405_007134 [Cladochytrium tenue]
MDDLVFLPAPAVTSVFEHLSGRDAACAALVSRAWAAAARRVLYASLKVRGEAGPFFLPTSSSPYALVGYRVIEHLGGPLPLVGGRDEELRPNVLACVRNLDIDFSDVHAGDFNFLRSLACSGARPRQLALTRPVPCSELVAALAPLAVHVSRLCYTSRHQYDYEPGLVGLFAGRLTALSLQAGSAATARTLLEGNSSTLRKLSVSNWSAEAIPVLIEYLNARPQLCDFSLQFRPGPKSNPAGERPAILEAIRSGCSTTLTRLELWLPELKAELILPVIPRLPNLRVLEIASHHENAEADPTPAPPTVWPPVSVLRLEHCSAALLPLLAGICLTIESLHLGRSPDAFINRRYSLLPHDALRLALDTSGAPCFPVLRNVEALQNYRLANALTLAQLQSIAGSCPNLERLELHGTIESLHPMRALPRLRHLTLVSALGVDPRLIQEAADLVLWGSDSAAPPRYIRALLCDSWISIDEIPPGTTYGATESATRRAASSAAVRTRGRLLFVEDPSLLPALF